MTRLLVVEPAGNRWGSERALLDLLDQLDGEVAVCTPPGRPLEEDLLRRGIPIFTSYVYALHEKSKLHRAQAAIGVLRACLAYRPDVIYLNQSGAFKVARVAARVLRIPVVAHLRIFEDVAYVAQQRPDPRLLVGLIAISGAIEQEVRRHGELDGIPCHTLLDAYARRGERSGPPLPPIQGRLACVGRIAPIKGQDVLVEAMSHLPAHAGPVECIIAGDDDNAFARELKARTAAGGQATCRWIGVVDDAVDLMRTCVGVVAPSHREPLGRVVFEAWDAGAVPVVYSGSGGAAEIITASGGGILYSEQSGPALAAAIERVLSLSKSERASLVGKGRDWLARTCDPGAYAQKVSAIFASAAKGGAAA